MEVTIPVWVLSNMGGFVGFGILSVVILRMQTQKRNRDFNKRLESQQEIEKEEQILDRLLPGPWKTLYKLLLPDMTRQSVLLFATTFKRDVSNIPPICPLGFDRVLEVSYYNLGGEGSCHEEFVEMLGDYVKFPQLENQTSKGSCGVVASTKYETVSKNGATKMANFTE